MLTARGRAARSSVSSPPEFWRLWPAKLIGCADSLVPRLLPDSVGPRRTQAAGVRPARSLRLISVAQALSSVLRPGIVGGLSVAPSGATAEGRS